MKRLFCAIAAFLVLVACADTPTTGDAAAGTTTVRLGFSAWPGWFPWQVAQEQGLFAKNGVTVDLKYFESYTDSLTALSTGNLDANSQTLNDTLSSVSGGAKQTVVLVNDNSTGNDQIIARPGITTVADLRGKKVAAEQGTVDHYLLLLALKQAGLSEKDVEFTPLLTDAAAAAFVAGKVDAVGVFAPFTTTALELPGSKAIATSKDFPGAIPDHLVFTAGFVKEHKTEVQAVVQTWFDTVAWIKANPDQAVEIMAKRGGVTATDYKSYDAGTTIFTKQQNLDAFTPGSTPANLDFQAQQIVEFLVATGLAEEKPPLDGLFDPSFVQAAK
ncbi:ABC transporter substrate-binding protein [Paractinoplanes rishiriensis]|uniref:Sulfonate ABC transporter substrate-binding protein n=1 Tax=Paractinoplanes rishiriensis TaxID=1050105 RepID=A0A919N1N1_9ACTN|nr:ABC transporter substrate-binding protein [Actinoplanes rishiriensis]GIE97357.1 sulfonate ABC transporter substrate-binding protein [Actinoplanes rishiriensis]